ATGIRPVARPASRVVAGGEQGGGRSRGLSSERAWTADRAPGRGLAWGATAGARGRDGALLSPRAARRRPTRRGTVPGLRRGSRRDQLDLSPLRSVSRSRRVSGVAHRKAGGERRV